MTDIRKAVDAALNCYVDENGETARSALAESDRRLACAPAEGEVAGLVQRLQHTITTASNDDYSEPDSEKRQRHVERLDALREAIAALTRLSDTPRQDSLQARVKPWMDACFGPAISADKQERNHRFLEEALELVQACGCTQSEAHQLVDYVYGRDQGDINQEVGGVMITLAALCLANDFDMHAAGETELARVWTKIDKIRAKQAAKPPRSPLPVAVSDTQSKGEVEAVALKPLQWRDLSSGGDFLHVASTPFDEYRITKEEEADWPFVVRPFRTRQSNYQTFEEAKADVEADYTRRMSEALSAPPNAADNDIIERAEPLRQIVGFVEELCDAIDDGADDVGGHRGTLEILRDIGPLVAPAKAALKTPAPSGSEKP